MSFSGLIEFNAGFSPRPHISHVVFDFDGTLSWLRHGWPGMMTQLFRENVPLLPGESDEALRELLLNDLLALNGKSSIHQMERCAEFVLERGGPPIDPKKLLAEYQRRLDLAIAERTKSILGGGKSRDDFLVFGARKFLEYLQLRKLRLIILSGTEQHRVREEAELLGVAQYFGRHIYGGTADFARSSKRAVIERLFGEEKIIGENLVCIGDGPVEIQIAREVGGLAIAVASDEEVNGSGRMHPQKRAQLTAAGADVLIPDYRDAVALFECILDQKES